MAGLASQLILLGDGDTPRPMFFGNAYSEAILTTTTPELLITGAPGYGVTQFGCSVDPTSTVAGGGIVVLNFTDSESGDWAGLRFYLPNSVGNPSNATALHELNPGPFIWNNKIANSTASVSLSSNLTSGSIRAFVRYARTQYLG